MAFLQWRHQFFCSVPVVKVSSFQLIRSRKMAFPDTVPAVVAILCISVGQYIKQQWFFTTLINTQRTSTRQ